MGRGLPSRLRGDPLESEGKSPLWKEILVLLRSGLFTHVNRS